MILQVAKSGLRRSARALRTSVCLIKISILVRLAKAAEVLPQELARCEVYI